ncbi:hypothetical protein LQ938_05990 [Microbacterium sp. cx-55]|uniref:SLAC1 family transporter n=1 Tax=Microbacterium sp. cx-55 TaxID=2875948 RepID=UPI001CC0853C|nr:hypothetical protein [Microbacterium sp. cx-55]MBZ4486707.1 hypothetical protein [Microbacterium sp. cx-55]UGB36333.1 hypothetical protein LQ938_05990 [Microbacterium sp. cx-55]
MSYSTLGIALGLAGLGSVWAGAGELFGVSPAIAEVMFAASAAWWLAVLMARLPVTRQRLRDLRADVRHPTTGPFPAYVPVVGLLLTSHYATYLAPELVQVLTLLWVAVLGAMSAQMLSFWLSGALQLSQIHPGYALPVIAGPYIAAIALNIAGYPALAIGAIGVGTFCWATIGTLIIVRLVASAPLPSPMLPTLAVLVTPPITAGLAWFAVRDGEIDVVQLLLSGITFLMVLTQVFMIPRYASASFSLAFWAFTFPAAALAGYLLRWAAVVPGTTTTLVAGIAVALATLAVLTVAIMSVDSARRARRRR